MTPERIKKLRACGWLTSAERDEVLDALEEAVRTQREDDTSGWVDSPLPEDSQIAAAFPTRSGRHDIYDEAIRLVGARQSKHALVALVNWLLHRAEALEKREKEKLEP